MEEEDLKAKTRTKIKLKSMIAESVVNKIKTDKDDLFIDNMFNCVGSNALILNSDGIFTVAPDGEYTEITSNPEIYTTLTIKDSKVISSTTKITIK